MPWFRRLCLLGSLITCCAAGCVRFGGASLPPGAAPPAWSALADFAIQLQRLNLNTLGASRYDLLVIDTAPDDSGLDGFSADQIKTLRLGGAKTRRVLAYLSIGEAESYRPYFNPLWVDDQGNRTPQAPAWLGPENPDWPGNYKVKYWDPSWQAILFGAAGALLDQILAAGYDGVYLDLVDAYAYWGPRGEGAPTRTSAEADMVGLVEALATYAHKTRPDFAVVPQNAEALGSHADYVQAVAGIGRESTWYDNDQAIEPATSASTVAALNVFKQAGKPVLCIDYPTSQAHIDDFYAKARAAGFLPYAAPKNLDALATPSPK